MLVLSHLLLTLKINKTSASMTTLVTPFHPLSKIKNLYKYSGVGALKDEMDVQLLPLIYQKC